MLQWTGDDPPFAADEGDLWELGEQGDRLSQQGAIGDDETGIDQVFCSEPID